MKRAGPAIRRPGRVAIRGVWAAQYRFLASTTGPTGAGEGPDSLEGEYDEEKFGQDLERVLRGAVESAPDQTAKPQRRDPRDPMAPKPGINTIEVSSPLDTTSLFELLRRSRQDPDRWTPDALAALYNISAAEVRAITEYITIPYMVMAGNKTQYAAREVNPAMAATFVLLGDEPNEAGGAGEPGPDGQPGGRAGGAQASR